MLSHDDNELLCRVGAGAAGGALMRQYWMAACLSSELPAADCDPLRVRLLGEDLVAFRDSSGKVGLVAEHCPHRRTSLFLGRNEAGGIRCVYHGWKFDRAGACLDMPNAPDSTLKDRLKHVAYPCEERGRIVWAYMGPMDPPPAFPKLPFADLPDDHICIIEMFHEHNWFQAMEASLDPCHPRFLHSAVSEDEHADRVANTRGGALAEYRWANNRAWNYEATEFGHGSMVAAWYEADTERNFWRINLFMLPNHTMGPIQAGEDPPASYAVRAPIDDEHVMVYGLTWHPSRALTESEVYRHQTYGFDSQYMPGDPLEAGSEWRPKVNRRNNYMLDRKRQRTKTFTGIPFIVAEDHAAAETQGPIFDRSTENLVFTDAGIVAARSVYLQAAKALRDRGETPPGVLNPEAYQMRAPNKLLPKSETNWVEALRDYYTFRPGYNPPMP